jgi:hypothetical protein
MGLHLPNAFGRIPCEPRSEAPAPGPELGMNKTKKVAPGINRRGGGYAACT